MVTVIAIGLLFIGKWLENKTLPTGSMMRTWAKAQAALSIKEKGSLLREEQYDTSYTAAVKQAEKPGVEEEWGV